MHQYVKMKSLVVLILLSTLSSTLSISIFNFKNNACLNKKDYFFQFLRSNKHCFHVDIADLKMPERIKHFVGDYAETHSVTTKDGYILKMFRFRHPKPKGVILMNPSYIGDSAMWLAQGNESLAYIYWQQGYDIWLPNHRGTDYSQTHVSLKSTDPLFWDFSFDEIGLYDVKALVDYVYKVTDSKIVMIGHSMSSTTSYIYAAMYPEEADQKLNLIVNTGPVAYTVHIQGLVLLASYFNDFLWNLIHKQLGYTNFFGNNDFIMRLIQRFYEVFPLKALSTWSATLSLGFTPNEADPIFIGTFLRVLSAQALKPIYHYGQLRASGRFAMYDYGEKENLLLYRQTKPPDYPLEAIRVPIYLIASRSDFLGRVKDVEMMYKRLRPEAKVYGIRFVSGMDHVSPIFGRHRLEWIWRPVLDLIEIVTYQR